MFSIQFCYVLYSTMTSSSGYQAAAESSAQFKSGLHFRALTPAQTGATILTENFSCLLTNDLISHFTNLVSLTNEIYKFCVIISEVLFNLFVLGPGYSNNYVGGRGSHHSHLHQSALTGTTSHQTLVRVIIKSPSPHHSQYRQLATQLL